MTPRGALARVEAALTVGELLLNEKGERIGNVLDVFGPVASSYAVIKPVRGITRDDLAKMVGKDVYVRGIREKARGEKRVPRVRKRKARA